MPHAPTATSRFSSGSSVKTAHRGGGAQPSAVAGDRHQFARIDLAMSGTVGLPSSIVIRDLMLNMWFRRWRILLIMVVSLCLAGFVAAQIDPKYQSKSMLLVLLGPEYGARPIAGELAPNGFNVA